MSADIRTYIKVVTVATASKLAQLWNHDTRASMPPNASAEYRAWNRTVIPLPEGETINDAWRRVAGDAIRSPLAVYATQFLIQYPRAWVQKSLNRDCDALGDQSAEFLLGRYGERMLFGSEHKDELGPHLQLLMVPLDYEANRVAQRRLLDEKGIRTLNRDYHDKVLKGFGIGTSFGGSRPTYKDIKAFDKAVNSPTVELTIAPDDIPDLPTVFTPAKKREYKQSAAQEITALVNERNLGTVKKANAVDLFRAENQNLEKTLRKKENYIEKLRSDREKDVDLLQQQLAREKEVADRYRDLNSVTLDASEVLEELGYRGRVENWAKTFHGVGNYQKVSVMDRCAKAASEDGNEVPVQALELTRAATGWTLADCFAFLLKKFGHKAQAALVAHVERLAARTRPNTPELNLHPSEHGWSAAISNLPMGHASAAVLELAHKKGKVVADATGNLNFLLTDASKQTRGIIVYAASDMQTPIREYGGSSEAVFSMGLPGARNRVLCRDPWSVLQLYSSVPEASTFCFCGTSQQAPVAFMAALGAPKIWPLMRYGFPAGDPHTTHLEQQLGSTRFSEILECEPKALGYRLMTDPPKPKATGFGDEHGRVERDVDAPGEDMLP